jgi:6-phosphogluconate dehydrogenase
LPILEVLAKPSGKVARFGGSGAGQYVKMIHNAIEYGMMQSLAEGYRMLKEGPYKDIDLVEAGDVWEHGSVIRSWLNELTRDALKANPELDGIDGKVAESGECRWTLEVAEDLGIALPATKAAFDVRLASLHGETNFATKIVAAQRNAFGGHPLNVAPGTGTSTSGK